MQYLFLIALTSCFTTPFSSTTLSLDMVAPLAKPQRSALAVLRQRHQERIQKNNLALLEPPAKKARMASHATPSLLNSFSSTSFDYSPKASITLWVGLDQIEMLVHSRYISSRSEFFKAALRGEWKEGQTRTIKLPEEHPKNVAIYLDFTYTRALPTSHITPLFLKEHDVNETFMNYAYAVLVELYLLGDRILDCGIQNAVVEEIIRLASLKFDNPGANHFPSAYCVDKIYNGTMPGSPLRRLLVDMHVSYGASAWLDEQAYSSTYLNDLARALIAKAEEKQTPTKFRMLAPKAQNYTV